MEFNLILPYENEIEDSDKTEIDRYIESTIELHKNNANKLTELTLEAASCLAAGEARAKQLSSQGFFKNLWGSITGKNRKIRGEIDYNFAVAQKASQRMIQVLAEQNKLTFEAVIAVNNKLNSMSVDINNQINEIYSVMKQMFQGLLGQIVQNSLKIEKLEQNVKLLNWNATIEYLTYDNRTYSSLDTFEKIICLSNDFYRMAGENRTTQDMLLLKTTMANCGIDINSKIKAIDFYRLLSSREDLIKRLFEDTKIENLEKALSYTIPISSGFRKLNLLAGEENYIVKSITSLSEASEEDIKVTLTKEYVKQHSDFDIEKEINIYEFAVMLVDDLGVIDSFVDESEVIEKETVPLLSESNTIETLFEECEYYKVIEECNKIIEFNENNEDANKEDLINAYKYRAKCYIHLVVGAQDDARSIRMLDNDNIESYLIESDILLENYYFNDEALEVIEEGLKEHSNNLELHKKKWEILYDQGLNHKNKKDFRDAKLSFNSILNDINEYIKINGEKYELLRAKIEYTDKFIVKNRLGTDESTNKSNEISLFSLSLSRNEITIFHKDFFARTIDRKECNDYNIFVFIEMVNKCILLNDKDSELHYLLAKYATSVRYNLINCNPYYLKSYTNYLDNAVADYLNIKPMWEYYDNSPSGGVGEGNLCAEYNYKFYGASAPNYANESTAMESNISISTILKHLDDALAIKPNYEEALLLKGVIYKIQKDNQGLLTLRDEYVKQGFDPDKIFNKLFND